MNEALNTIYDKTAKKGFPLDIKFSLYTNGGVQLMSVGTEGKKHSGRKEEHTKSFCFKCETNETQELYRELGHPYLWWRSLPQTGHYGIPPSRQGRGHISLCGQGHQRA